MIKLVVVLGYIVISTGLVHAQTIIFDNGGSGVLTTGDLLDEASDIGISTNVIEVSGLKISAKAGVAGQKINTTSASLGITLHGSGDVTDRFEENERMTFSFDKKVQISRFDFIGFVSNSIMTIAVDGQPDLLIGYTDLTNKGSQFFSTNLIVEADTEIDLYVGNANSVIGLQEMDVTIVGGTGEPQLSLTSSNGTSVISIEFDGIATTNYVLQSSADMGSNGWNTVSSPVIENTNWIVETTKSAEFYRLITE